MFFFGFVVNDLAIIFPELSKEKKIPLSKFINQKWALLRAGPVTKYNSNAGKRVEVIFKKNNIDLNENVTSFSSPAALFASSKKTKSLAIAARSLSNVANNFELTELNTEHILDLDIGILVRNKIANYNVIKYMIRSLSKYLD